MDIKTLANKTRVITIKKDSDIVIEDIDINKEPDLKKNTHNILEQDNYILYRVIDNVNLKKDIKISTQELINIIENDKEKDKKKAIALLLLFLLENKAHTTAALKSIYIRQTSPVYAADNGQLINNNYTKMINILKKHLNYIIYKSNNKTNKLKAAVLLLITHTEDDLLVQKYIKALNNNQLNELIKYGTIQLLTDLTSSQFIRTIRKVQEQPDSQAS